MTGRITTVLGDVPASSLGRTLTHEHIFVNLTREFRGTGLLNDPALMKSELAAFAAAGGGTIVELTPAELSIGASPDPGGILGGVPDPDPRENWTRAASNVVALKAISEASGVHLVLGTGHYRDPYLAEGGLLERSVAELAERMIDDITEGFPGTEVRAGIIGEIGIDKWHMSALEEKSHRAAARAQLRTGVAISTHTSRWPVGVLQLDFYAAEGVDPHRVIVGHCDAVNSSDYHLALAQRGAFVQFDTIRGGADFEVARRAQYVLDLASAGYLDQILLSHDVCRRDHLLASGSGGFVYILEGFRKVLVDRGMDAAEVEHILVENPKRALCGRQTNESTT